MRLSILLMLVFSFSLSAETWAQQEKINLDVKDVSINTLLREIQRQTKFDFVFSVDQTADLGTFTIQAKDEALESVLKRTLTDRGLTFEFMNDLILIRRLDDEKKDEKNKEVKITGTVTDTEKTPLPGVTVKLKDVTLGTVTDNKGHYELRFISKDEEMIVVYSFVGMKTVEVLYEGVDTINVVMEEEQVALEDVVVTGYGQTTKRRVTGSVGVLTRDAFENKAVPNVDMLLQGQLAGVAVTATTGRPGASSKIRIRGTNTLSVDAEPLWVVDGVPLQADVPEISTGQINSGNMNEIFVRGIAGINPNDIENVTILKDASAAAIYGSRAAGGVIVVTTKRGQAGHPRINYAVNLVMGLKPQRDANLMNSSEKLAWEQELWDEFSADAFASGADHVPVVGIVGMLRAEKLGRNDLLWSEDGFEPLSTNEQNSYIETLRKNTTDWFDVIFRNSFSMTHYLSISGGSEETTYHVSLGYNEDNGLVKETDFKRYNLSAKLDTRPANRLKVGFGIDLARLESSSSSMDVDPFTYAYFANPYERPYNEDGSYRADMTYFNLGVINDGYGAENPALPTEGFNILREMTETSGDAEQVDVTARATLSIHLLDNFRVEGLVSYSYTSDKVSDIKGENTYAAFSDKLYFDQDVQGSPQYGNITRTFSTNNSYNARLQFTYDVAIKDHSLSLLGGTELRGSKAFRVFSKRYGYDEVTGNATMPLPPNPTDDDVSEYAELIDDLAGESTSENRFASFYAAADYAYLGRYLLSLTFRTDGSNNFGSDEQFNPTWSLGLAWHIDEEGFMQILQPWVSSLTLRLAMGYTGNIVKGVKKELVLNYSSSYWNGERVGYVSTAPNPKIRWEKTKDMKFAVDLGLFDNRITGLVEGYYRKSLDIISNVDMVSTTGFSNQAFNTSEIENKGIEGTLRVNVLNGKNLKLNIGGNIAWNRNKLTRYRREGEAQLNNGLYEGFPLDAIFSGRYTGIDPRDGIYTYELRPDAQIQTATDLQNADNYRFYLGTSTAPVTGGVNFDFSYRGWRLSIGGYFSSGAKILNKIDSPASYSMVTSYMTGEKPQTSYSDLYRNHLNVTRDMTDRWTPECTRGVKYPRLIDYMGERLLLDQYNVHTTSITDGTYLEDVSFLRIRDITLYYTMPREWMKAIGISSLSFSMTLNNFFTFTSYNGIDPETPGATYPLSRSISWGINVGF